MEFPKNIDNPYAASIAFAIIGGFLITQPDSIPMLAGSILLSIGVFAFLGKFMDERELERQKLNSNMRWQMPGQKI
ncbi:MAG: hypothetical protein AABW99_01770 [archaeon]